MDEQIIANATALIGRQAADLYLRGQHDQARAISEQVKRIVKQLELNRPPETPCKKCGRPVPDVPIGRPRLYCEIHRRSRAKVPGFGEARETIRA